MDRAGIDMQALSINGCWWYAADRDVAARIVRAQNEGLAKIVSTYPDRFVALASVSLQFPDLAAQQLEDAVKRLDLRGVSIGGHVNGEDLRRASGSSAVCLEAPYGVPRVETPCAGRPHTVGGRRPRAVQVSLSRSSFLP